MDSSLIYWIVAGIGALVLTLSIVKLVKTDFTPEQLGEAGEIAPGGHRPPSAPLQIRAWWSLAIGTATTLAILPFFLKHGVVAVYLDRGLRLPVTAIFVAGVVGFALVLKYPRIALDERDQMIVGRTPKFQLVSVFLALAAWAIALTEIYWDRGAIPVAFPYLMMESIIIVNILAYSAGILLGYRRL